MQAEMQKFRADFIASLAKPIILLEMISLVSLINLFAPEEPIQTLFGRRPCMDEDQNKRNAM